MKFSDVQKPSRYVGGEYGVPPMKEDAKTTFCMCFPDSYEVGMSNLGIRILYYILNDMKDVRCERCFAPWPDYAEYLKENSLRLRSLETGTPLADFDIVGFSLQYELSYTNVLYMLELAGIPLTRQATMPPQESFSLIRCSTNSAAFSAASASGI